MSVSLGKEKNWGSRSGKKSTKRRKKTLIDKLIDQGISDEILEGVLTGDPELLEAMEKLAHKRETIRGGEGRSPEKVFNTKLGRLYKADCIDLLNSMEDESLDCIFADPPFNLSKDYSNGQNDAMPEEEYLEWTRAWIELSAQKLKEGGSFFVYNIPKWAMPISNMMSEFLTFRHWIAVDITFSMPIPGRLYPSHYSLLYFVKGAKPKTFNPHRTPIKTCKSCGKEQNDYGGYKSKMNPEGINIRDVWSDIPPVRHSKFKNRDANELHLRLLDRVLDIATEEGDVVFDPFGGSGTTFVAAELKKRKWIGCEIGDCEPIIERLKNPETDQEQFNKFRKNLNVLFTDEAIKTRFKSGMGVGKYRVDEEQIERALGKTELLKARQLDLI